MHLNKVGRRKKNKIKCSRYKERTCLGKLESRKWMKGYSSIQITTAGYTDTGKIIQSMQWIRIQNGKPIIIIFLESIYANKDLTPSHRNANEQWNYLFHGLYWVSAPCWALFQDWEHMRENRGKAAQPAGGGENTETISYFRFWEVL